MGAGDGDPAGRVDFGRRGAGAGARPFRIFDLEDQPPLLGLRRLHGRRGRLGRWKARADGRLQQQRRPLGRRSRRRPEGPARPPHAGVHRRPLPGRPHGPLRQRRRDDALLGSRRREADSRDRRPGNAGALRRVLRGRAPGGVGRRGRRPEGLAAFRRRAPTRSRTPRGADPLRGVRERGPRDPDDGFRQPRGLDRPRLRQNHRGVPHRGPQAGREGLRLP